MNATEIQTAKSQALALLKGDVAPVEATKDMDVDTFIAHGFDEVAKAIGEPVPLRLERLNKLQKGIDTALAVVKAGEGAGGGFTFKIPVMAVDDTDPKGKVTPVGVKKDLGAAEPTTPSAAPAPAHVNEHVDLTELVRASAGPRSSD